MAGTLVTTCPVCQSTNIALSIVSAQKGWSRGKPDEKNLMLGGFVQKVAVERWVEFDSLMKAEMVALIHRRQSHWM